MNLYILSNKKSVGWDCITSMLMAASSRKEAIKASLKEAEQNTSYTWAKKEDIKTERIGIYQGKRTTPFVLLRHVFYG